MASPSTPHFSKSEIVQIVVGKDKPQTFFIHRDLVAPSKFFKACIESGMKESESKVITLPEDEPALVEVFIKWAYLKTIDVEDLRSHANIVKLFAFADKICCEGYCNTLMDAVSKFDIERRLFWSVSLTAHIHQTGLRNSMLAKYATKDNVFTMLANSVTYAKNEPFTNLADLSIPEMVQDMFREILEYQKNPYARPATLDKCLFHTHADDSKCAAKSEPEKK